ncbi:hypothetical protein C7H19_25215, partial [Aphanothece hegewaldii CCALA 016]
KEFIYTTNNSRVSEAIQISLTPPPDLKVTDLIAPSAIEAGQKIDFSWTITNDGTGKAVGAWVDEIYLQAVSTLLQPLIWLGSFTYDQGLAAGQFYTRKEQIAIPSTLQGLYQIVVKTNTLHSLYEHGATGNNTAVDNDPLLITLPPRPDLQVQLIEAPQEVNAGGTGALAFVVINSGTVPTTTSWQDHVYLSLDNKISSDDFLLGSPTNESALAPQESYLSSTLSFVVPKRMIGEVFLIVQANADGKVNEYPQNSNNTLAVPLNVIGLPLADLVTENVTVPNQAFEGSTIPIRYTVINKGIGETDRDEWTDTIWLTRDKKRPSPVNAEGNLEDILLAQITHSGSLQVGHSYEQIINVTLPEQVTGEWYITPWSDTYDIVLEDT